MKQVSILFFFVVFLFTQKGIAQEKKYVYVYPDDAMSTTTKVGPNLLQIHNGNLQTAIEKARRERKLVFLDFYASWCGPCKQIEKEVFTDKAFADYVNQNYVVYKVNMDDLSPGGGGAYAEKMLVYDLPVLMVIDLKGNEIGRVTGFKTANTYLYELQKLERYAAYQR